MYQFNINLLLIKYSEIEINLKLIRNITLMLHIYILF